MNFGTEVLEAYTAVSSTRNSRTTCVLACYTSSRSPHAQPKLFIQNPKVHNQICTRNEITSSLRSSPARDEKNLMPASFHHSASHVEGSAVTKHSLPPGN